MGKLQEPSIKSQTDLKFEIRMTQTAAGRILKAHRSLERPESDQVSCAGMADADGESRSASDVLPYQGMSPLPDASGWIRVRRKGCILDVQFPRSCCVCLRETDDSWNVPLVTAA
jgi:hypothetical protein